MSCLVTASCFMFRLSEERPLLASRGGCRAARLPGPNSCLNLGPQGGRTPPVGPIRSQDPSDLPAFTLLLSLKTGREPACVPPLEFVGSTHGLACIPFPSGFPPLACTPLPKPFLAVQSLHWNVLPLCQTGLGLTGLTLLR